MLKLNCWEFKKCGREPGGKHADEHGVCPAATDSSSHDINDGHNAGRICWSVAGTFCNGNVQCDLTAKYITCMACRFFKIVQEEEDPDTFILLKPVQYVSRSGKK